MSRARIYKRNGYWITARAGHATAWRSWERAYWLGLLGQWDRDDV